MSIGTNPDEFRASFFEECEELLEAMTDGFDQMADDLQDSETMHAIFRAVHSIKGGAGAFRLDDLVAFAHHFETSLDMVRSGKVEADDDLLDLFRQCGDHLSDLVEMSRNGSTDGVDGTQALCDRLTEATGNDPAEEEVLPEFEPVALQFDFAPGPEEAGQGFEIGFQADPGLFTSGNEVALLFRALEHFGQIEVRANLDDVPPLDDLTHEVCAISWTVTVDTDADEADIRDVFDFVEDVCALDIATRGAESAGALDLPDLPDLSDGPPDGLDVPSLDAVLADLGGDAEADDLETDATGADETEAGEADAAVESPKAKGKEAGKDKSKKPAGTIRVDLEKVDKLINLVGELVIKEAVLSQSISEFNPPSESDVSVGLENLKQLASDIQEGVMAIRAQPVKQMFQRMSRIVREASAATGKPVRFVTDGEYTEVDKTVLERLVDPLTHMLRNAIDHGLESPEDRQAAGKPAEGTVTLTAAHRSGRVMIDISDDGGGINRERVKQLAIDRGLVPENADLSPTEIDNLLFMPGFSSKEEVSELSGRGVGLDVARSEIQGLGGRVSIRSTPGDGTTFSISLPLTLAVLEGMVIRVADQTMVVPISAVQETLKPMAGDIETLGSNGRVLRNRSGLVPIIDLGMFFGFRSEPTSLDSHVLMLIESAKHQKFALIVDEIQDQRQVVIKSLETNYQQIEGIAAATILGDGRIALIIDPDNIIVDPPLGGPAELATRMAG